MNILLIEPNPRIGNGFAEWARGQRVRVEHTWGVEGGQERAASGEFDAVLINQLLHDGDCMELTRDLRARGVTSLIIALAWSMQKEEVLPLLHAGADMVLPWDTDPELLLAQVQAALGRRAPMPGPQAGGVTIWCDSLRIDTGMRTVRRGNLDVLLEPSAFDLLVFMVLRRGQLLTRDDLEPVLAPHGGGDVQQSLESLHKRIDAKALTPLIHRVDTEVFTLAVLPGRSRPWLRRPPRAAVRPVTPQSRQGEDRNRYEARSR